MKRSSLGPFIRHTACARSRQRIGRKKHGHENVFPHIGTTAPETASCPILIGKAGNSFSPSSERKDGMRRWNRLWDVVLGVIVSLLCAFPVSAREKVILDSDMVEGFDDGVAMLALAQSPGIELIGVTIVAGNTWVSDGVAYALRQLEIAGQNIPVAAGVDRPFRPQRYELFGLERQLFGMGHDAWVGAFGYPKPESWQKVYRERYGKEPQSRPDPRHAVDFIIEEVRKHPGELTIAEIGPCSNLALAVLKAPDIVPLIKRVIFMGGSFFKPGNVTPTAEFNWWFDPEAARIVVRTPFREQIMVGLDVCEKMPFSSDRYQAFLAGQRPEMKKLLESTYAGQQFAKDKAFSQYVWDVLAAAILIDPSLITEERTCAVDVNAEFGPSYGQALAYPDNGPQGSQKARIVMTIDQERFWNMLTAR